MFIALYEFQVKPGKEEIFKESWAALTREIQKARASLGSRLHKADDGTYVAYAQWPSKVQYEKNAPLPPEATEFRSRMMEACERTSVLKLMEVEDDLLVKQA